MWSGFGPDIPRQFERVRELVSLRHLTPTKEWPLIFVNEHDELLVIREWPNGSVTAYATREFSDRLRKG